MYSMLKYPLLRLKSSVAPLPAPWRTQQRISTDVSPRSSSLLRQCDSWMFMEADPKLMDPADSLPEAISDLALARVLAACPGTCEGPPANQVRGSHHSLVARSWTTASPLITK